MTESLFGRYKQTVQLQQRALRAWPTVTLGLSRAVLRGGGHGDGRYFRAAYVLRAISMTSLGENASITLRRLNSRSSALSCVPKSRSP